MITTEFHSSAQLRSDPIQHGGVEVTWLVSGDVVSPLPGLPPPIRAQSQVFLTPGPMRRQWWKSWKCTLRAVPGARSPPPCRGQSTREVLSWVRSWPGPDTTEITPRVPRGGDKVRDRISPAPHIFSTSTSTWDILLAFHDMTPHPSISSVSDVRRGVQGSCVSFASVVGRLFVLPGSGQGSKSSAQSDSSAAALIQDSGAIWRDS